MLDDDSGWTLTPQDISALLEQTALCFYCKRPMPHIERTLNYITPIAKGGQHVISNVCVCCRGCSDSKGSRTVDEWIAALIRKSLIVNRKRYSAGVSYTTGAASAVFDSFSTS